MAVYARRSRTRHKPAWRAKQRGPEAEHEREYQASRAEELRLLYGRDDACHASPVFERHGHLSHRRPCRALT